MTTVFLSLGSNIDRQHNIGSGLDDLAAAFGELKLSPVYESEAVGFKGSPFFNLVVALETELPVAALADRLRDIERAHGRVRGEKKFASRTVCSGIRTDGEVTGEIDGGTLARNEILKHAFVMRPLADLAPDARHPELGRPYAALLDEYRFPEQRLWQVPFVWP